MLTKQMQTRQLKKVLSSYATELIRFYYHIQGVLDFPEKVQPFRLEYYFFRVFFILIGLNIFSTIFKTFFDNKTVACFNLITNFKTILTFHKLLKIKTLSMGLVICARLG